MLKEKRLKRKVKYTSDFLTLYEDDVVLPSGQFSTRVVVDHIGAAAVLPITKGNKIILVKQHRYAAGIDAIEIPAGKKDTKGEDPLACVKRELIEETAYTSDDFTYLTTIHSAIGFSNEKIALYLAKDVVPYHGEIKADEEEYLEILQVSYQEAKRLLNRGDITDAKTVVALLMFFNTDKGE